MNIDMIRAAAERAKGHVRRTPLLNSPFLDEIAGRRVWVKPECLQHTGSLLLLVFEQLVISPVLLRANRVFHFKGIPVGLR